jgi:hypothetical protein
MANFPTNLDTLTNPQATDTLNNPSHSTQHINANDILEALEAKVGKDSSAVTTSHDYKLSAVTGTAKAVSTTLLSTTSTKGILRLSTAPVSATEPIAVGDNDNRVSPVSLATVTADRVAALAGTGTPNGTNKYVTNDDTGTSGAGKCLRLDGSGKLPAVDGSQLTGLAVSSSYTAGPAITAGQAICIAPYTSSAIAIDTALADGALSTTNLTTAFTVANNSNRGLVVFAMTNHAVSGVTYNGVAMTQVSTSGAYCYIFYLNNPDTGTHNIVVSSSASTQFGITAYSVYNVKQSDQPEANAIGTGTTAAVTTTTDGAMVIGATQNTPSGTWYYANKVNYSTLIYSGQSSAVFPIQSVSCTLSSGFFGVVSLTPYTAVTGDLCAVPASAANSTNQFYNLYDTFIGFANANANAGASVNVTIGGEFSGLTGLNALSKPYYLQNTAGTIGLSVGTNTKKVGISTSTTKLNIINS